MSTTLRHLFLESLKKAPQTPAGSERDVIESFVAMAAKAASIRQPLKEEPIIRLVAVLASMTNNDPVTAVTRSINLNQADSIRIPHGALATLVWLLISILDDAAETEEKIREAIRLAVLLAIKKGTPNDLNDSKPAWLPHAAKA